VSDGEIRFLQMARGASAKTQLCWYWLSEFCIREHLAGTLGAVGPPIISRIIQFLGDGMISYNHARKIVFIPFPFPHAQLAVLFVLVTIPAVAFLMDQYADDIILGSVLTFFSVACLSATHEVARELENPFRNVPNEIPLVTLQAQFNEALITMYSGYHPDHYWDPTRHDHHPADPPPMRKKASKGRPGSPPPGTPPATPSTPARPATPPPAASETAATTNESEAEASSPSTQNGDAAVELQRMQAKMEEFSKEIERLRSCLEASEANKKA